MNVRSYNCCTTNKHEFNKVISLTSLFKLISVESRLKILCILQQGSHCVCEIEQHVSESQSLISHHLRELKEAGLIKDDKKGQFVHYKLTGKGKHIISSLLKL
ncbi:winged helix-turn-helix transcriptional regulator [Candidatus Roizmanbacteria bacterium]|jgi:ArsR family transcriptional regulator|nr:winged helix-turn-helix transcriptional regulator [Candidatus Roizmanbacteria bacterium]